MEIPGNKPSKLGEIIVSIPISRSGPPRRVFQLYFNRISTWFMVPGTSYDILFSY